MTKPSKAILLLNIGSPNSFKTSDVRSYLREFLMDKRVINIPWLIRFLLVNVIITTFRAPKSAKKYKEIWNVDGSPLMIHSYKLKEKLQNLYQDSADVYVAMRYGNPTIDKVLAEIKSRNYSQLIICPLFPQNASSTTSSAVEKCFSLINKWENIPQLKVISEFWNSEYYIQALIKQINEFKKDSIDHIIFSFHGLPLSQVHKAHKGKTCESLNCCIIHNHENKYCYQAVCYQSTKIVVSKLGLAESDYSIAFQSRMSKNWLSPFTDEVLENLAKQGKKNVLIVCPSFVADCLETIHEIEIEYAEQFKVAGGEKLTLVPALNSEDFWVKALMRILNE